MLSRPAASLLTVLFSKPSRAASWPWAMPCAASSSVSARASEADTAGDPAETALPGTALPGAALPGTALPGTALPGTALPGTALPGTAPAGAAPATWSSPAGREPAGTAPGLSMRSSSPRS